MTGSDPPEIAGFYGKPPATAGFYGKLPARGDFVRAGLPKTFIDPWDVWWQRMLPGSRDRLGEAWTEAWLQAPIWRFALPPGQCGADAVLGLWMPSVDQAGRFFPLTIAIVAAQPLPALLRSGGGFLAAAEIAGLAAVQEDMPPDTLGAQIAAAARATEAEAGPPPPEPGAAIWWTEGSPLVPAQAVSPRTLPGIDAFTAMIAGTAAET